MCVVRSRVRYSAVCTYLYRSYTMYGGYGTLYVQYVQYVQYVHTVQYVLYSMCSVYTPCSMYGIYVCTYVVPNVTNIPDY